MSSLSVRYSPPATKPNHTNPHPIPIVSVSLLTHTLINDVYNRPTIAWRKLIVGFRRMRRSDQLTLMFVKVNRMIFKGFEARGIMLKGEKQLTNCSR